MLHFSRSGSIWRHRDLRLMLPARALSAFGDQMAVVALTLRVYEQSHDAWAVTGLLLCSAAPIAALARVAGRLVDALPFRTVAAAAAVWQAACCVALAAAAPVWATYALVLALQVGQVAAGPAWQALIPAVAERDEVGRVVGASQALTMLAWVAAPAAAGATVGTVGYAAPLLVDAATFLALGGAALAVRASRGGAGATGGPGAAGASFSLRADALLWPLVLGLCALVLVGQVTNVVEVFLVRGSLGASATVFGLLGGVLAAALAAGSLLAGRAAADALRARRTIAAALVLALALLGAGLAPGLAVFAAAWVLAGLTNGMLNTDASTLLLNRTPERARGRVLATVNGMTQTASVGALALGGLAGTLLGPRVSFVVAATAMAAVAAGLLVRIGRVAGAPPVRATPPAGAAESP